MSILDDYSTGEMSAVPHNPALLKPGTLVYLWSPNERAVHQPAERPVLAKVERSTVDNIVGIDLRDGGRAIYEVGAGVAPNFRWTWEVAAAPQRPTVCDGVEIVTAPGTLEQRARFVVGEPGVKLQIRLTSGELLHGVLTKLVMGQDQWEAEWAELVDQVPGSDRRVHVVRVAEVAAVTRFDGV